MQRIGNSNGWINIRVTINSQRCNVVDLVLNKQVYVGAPTLSSVETVPNGSASSHLHPSVNPNEANGCEEIGLKLNFAPDNSFVTDIEWEKITEDVQWSRDYIDYDDNYVYLYPTCNKEFKFRVRARGICGTWSQWEERTYQINSCNSDCPPPFNGLISDNFVLAPVPAYTELGISVVDNPTWLFPTLGILDPNNGTNILPGGGISNQGYYNPDLNLPLAFYNNSGTLVHSTILQGVPGQVDVSGLAPGVYTLVITYHNNSESHQITIY